MEELVLSHLVEQKEIKVIKSDSMEKGQFETKGGKKPIHYPKYKS